MKTYLLRAERSNRMNRILDVVIENPARFILPLSFALGVIAIAALFSHLTAHGEAPARTTASV